MSHILDNTPYQHAPFSIDLLIYTPLYNILRYPITGDNNNNNNNNNNNTLANPQKALQQHPLTLSNTSSFMHPSLSYHRGQEQQQQHSRQPSEGAATTTTERIRHRSAHRG